MPMTSEQSVVGGRETFGEPKKLAALTLERSTERVSGTVARMGTTVIEITGTIAGDLEPPVEETRTDFYFKFLPAPDGRGFDSDPHLVYCERTERVRTISRVDGEVLLRESRFDPVADLPVLELRGITLSERSSVQRGRLHQAVPADWIRPYVHQRYDDLTSAGRK